jgi:hypothetical protein
LTCQRHTANPRQAGCARRSVWISLLGYAPFVPTAFEMSWETPVVAWVISANDPRSVTVGDSYELVVNASSPCVALQ